MAPWQAILTQHGVLRVEGEDAETFLHSQFSNDVKNMGGRAQYGSYSTAKGRMLATFLLCPMPADQGGGYLMMLSAEILPTIEKRLRMFVLRSKVSLRDASADYRLCGVSGLSDLPESLPVPAAPMDCLPLEGGGIAVRLDAERCLYAGPAAASLTAGTAVDADYWAWLDIRAGIPWLVTATQEQYVPQMANLDLIGGISFKKGCYPGQEIVARTQYIGQVKRRMFRAHVEVEAVAPGERLFTAATGEQANGTVLSAAPSPDGGCELLAVLQVSAPETDVHLGTPAGPLLHFAPLPYFIPASA